MALTITDVAARLNLPVETIHRWVRQGKIPMQSKGETYTIRSEMLERWASEHKLEIQEQSDMTPPTGEKTPAFDSLAGAMQRGGIFYDVPGDNRESVLHSAVELIPNLSQAESQGVCDMLIERELLASTGIGHGIALPHPRSHPDISLKMPQITTCFLAAPIDYKAIDGQSVEILMVLLSHSTKQHLDMLSKLSFHLRESQFRDYLLTRPLESDILSKVAAMESTRDPIGGGAR